jgi:exopolyphosphatase/guanosine-5'-triphosphate,3'-diphosphate pyrophosphatase
MSSADKKPRSVAVIDIGSNSIKVLVAARAGPGPVTALASRTIDARISAGISHLEPRLSEAGMARGLDAIGELLGDAAAFAPATVVLVATSAVRDAANGAAFGGRVHARTGHAIRILTGEEEANYIGRGLTCDPALADLQDFYVFDLGGGSLECLAFRRRQIAQAVSLGLGCVRLTEKFVADPSAPFSAEARAKIAAYTTTTLTGSSFRFTLPGAVGVGTGGTVSTVRAILGTRAGHTVEATDPRVTLDQLRHLLDELGALTLAQRRQVPGLPAARADVFPGALATIIALAELAGLAEFRHSFHNLRWGIAAEALDQL